MKQFFCSSIVWAVIVAIAYFATDIIDKGQTLNNIHPYLGWALWLAIFLVLWFLFFQPIISFCRLNSATPMSLPAQVKKMLKSIDSFRTAPLGDPKRKLFLDLYKVREDRLYQSAEQKAHAVQLLDEARGYLDIEGQERKLIRSYCLSAGVGVAFSRNNMLDGVILLVIQMRLVIALAKLRGYRPSPVFNTCCLGWMLGSSVVMALTQDVAEDLSETAADFMVDLVFGDDELRTNLIEMGAAKMLLSVPVNLLIQAIMAGTSVYITGRLFQFKLNRDGRKLTMKTLMELRREGRKEVGGAVLSEVPGAIKKTFGNFATKGLKAVFGIDEKDERKEETPDPVDKTATPAEA